MSLYPPPWQPTQQLVTAVLRQIQSTHYADESSPRWDAEREYSAEQVALAARELVRAVDALPEGQRPIGWDTDQPDPTVPQADLRALIEDFTDPDPCHYDHHGYCQAHFWPQTEPRCPHARAKELLADTLKEN